MSQGKHTDWKIWNAHPPLKQTPMKKYKLKLRYPGSPRLETIATYRNILVGGTTEDYDYILTDSYHQPLTKDKVENYPEFWEEIIEAKPDFITEDGVEYFISSDPNKEHQRLFSVLTKANWQQEMTYLYNCSYKDKAWKHFSTSESRKEYIAKHKPCFSLNDIEQAYTSPKDSPLYESLVANLKKLGN